MSASPIDNWVCAHHNVGLMVGRNNMLRCPFFKEHQNLTDPWAERADWEALTMLAGAIPPSMFAETSNHYAVRNKQAGVFPQTAMDEGVADIVEDEVQQWGISPVRWWHVFVHDSDPRGTLGVVGPTVNDAESPFRAGERGVRFGIDSHTARAVGLRAMPWSWVTQFTFAPSAELAGAARDTRADMLRYNDSQRKFRAMAQEEFDRAKAL